MSIIRDRTYHASDIKFLLISNQQCLRATVSLYSVHPYNVLTFVWNGSEIGTRSN